MPLPDSPLVVNGDCNCGAIRYKIQIPELQSRPLHPSSDDSSGPLQPPMVAIDHCNDCRRATGAFLPLWILTPISMVTASLVLRSTGSLDPDASKRKAGATEQRGAWLPAKTVFEPGPTSADSFLTFYESSEGRRRTFCGRCGTSLAYAIFPMLEGWPDMLDIVLGTIDRQDLENDGLAPERHLWWECGIPWVQRLSDGGAEALPKYPIYKINEFVE